MSHCFPQSNFNLTQEALRQSEEIFRLMVESVEDYAIFVLDPEGYIMTWNPGAQRYKGYRAEEIIGRHFSVFYGEEDKQAGKPERELEEALRDGRVEDSGWRLRKDGTKFWANVTITTLRGSDGTLRGFCKVTRDMTEKKMADEELRRSEERLRLMIESVWDYSIYMLDENGIVTSWNIGAERTKGYKYSEIIGKNFACFYSEEDIRSGKPRRNLDTALREGHCLDEGWRYRRDGSRFWASVVITPVKDAQGKLLGFAKVTRDMTERKLAENELEQKVLARTRELAKKNRELEQFAYVASHDLQEPLRMVSSYVDLLNMQCSAKLAGEELKILKYISDGAKRAQELIRDLLEFSQVEAQGGNFKLTDLNLLMGQVLANLKVQLEESKAEIEIGLLPVLSVDGSRIFQLFQNLISNAVKYRGDEAVKIKVTAREEAQGWTFCVQDNGIGIAPEHYKKIFELFQRLHSKDQYPGTGLGLAICQKIVEYHNGRIWVESEPGKGSAFKFTLPKQ